MNTNIVLIISVIAVYSAHSHNAGQSNANYLMEQRFFDMERRFDRFSDTIRLKMNDWTTLLSLRLYVQDFETKKILKKLTENLNELSQKFEKSQYTILKRFDENQNELSETNGKLASQQERYLELSENAEEKHENILKRLNDSEAFYLNKITQQKIELDSFSGKFGELNENLNTCKVKTENLIQNVTIIERDLRKINVRLFQNTLRV